MSKFCKTARYNIAISVSTGKLLDQTVVLYRSAVAYFLAVIQDNQSVLEHGNWLRQVEILTHRTAKNPNPQYDFDQQFPLMPSGLRRAAIAEAHGLAQAWQNNYRQWQKHKTKHEARNQRRIINGKKPIRLTVRPPVYPDQTTAWPTYYATEYRLLDERHLLLKIYTGTGYGHRKIALLKPWLVPAGYKPGSPVLIKKRHGWVIHVPLFLDIKVHLQKAKDIVQDPNHRICAVDLGINHHAVCTIQDAKGRALATLTLSGARDNHFRKRRLEQIAGLQKQTRVIPKGECFAVLLWRKVRNQDRNTAHRVSRRIVDFAGRYGAKAIVFEHLKSLRPIRGTRSRRHNHRLAYWLRGRVFRFTQYKALHRGIICVCVNPRNTSRRCPYCGFLAIRRYTPGQSGGVKLARCDNCGVRDINADWLATQNIGQKFRLRYPSPA